ncbi:MAG: hypothetical protein ACXW5U_23500 [Thermoanaerobaculia bacterium]
MNALAAAALVLLAVAQDPRAFRMPKKAEPPKAEQPAPEVLPVPSDPLPAKPAESVPSSAPEPAPAPAPETASAPAPETASAPAPETASAPEPAPAPEPEPESESAAAPRKPLMFELPGLKNDAAPATGNGQRATPEPATSELARPDFTLPNQPPRQKKPKAPRPFRLPEKSDVSN